MPVSIRMLRSSSCTSRARQLRAMRFCSSVSTQRDHRALGALPNMAPPSSRWLLPSRVVKVRMGFSLAGRRANPTAGGVLQIEGVADDQPVLVHIGGVVAAIGRVAPVQGQILQRAALDHVDQIGVALPFLAAATGMLDVVAMGVAVHQLQTGQTQIGEGIVMTYLPA